MRIKLWLAILASMLLLGLTIPTLDAGPDFGYSVGTGKWFGATHGANFGHPDDVPPDFYAVFNAQTSIAGWGWSNWNPGPGTFVVPTGGHLSKMAATGINEMNSWCWEGAPGWSPSQQDFIASLQYADAHMPPGTHINLCCESLHAGQWNHRDVLGGNGSTGWDWMIQAFKLAHQYAPHLKFGVLDYNLLGNDQYPTWDTGKTTAFINQIQTLQKAGAAPDYLADEGDFYDGMAENGQMQLMTDSLNRIGQLGIPIWCDQLDVNGAGDVGNQECTNTVIGSRSQGDAEQLADMQAIFSALWSNQYLVGIIYFDTSQIFGDDYPYDGSGYPACYCNNDWLYTDDSDGPNGDSKHRSTLDWIQSFIGPGGSGHSPPNAFAFSTPTPSPSPSPTPTPAPSPSPSPTASASPNPSASPTATPTPESTPTPTPGSTPNRGHRGHHRDADSDPSLWEEFIQWLGLPDFK